MNVQTFQGSRGGGMIVVVKRLLGAVCSKRLWHACMRQVTRCRRPSSRRLIHIHIYILVTWVRTLFFIRRLRVVVEGRRRRQVVFLPGALPATKKFTDDVIRQTQVRDISGDPR